MLQAVNDSNFNAVGVLLNKGANPNTQDRYRRPVLILAIENALRGNWSLGIVHELLDGGANPNAHIKMWADKGGIFYFYPPGTTPLMAAVTKPSVASGQRLDLVRLLLKKGVDPRLRSQDGGTALTRAKVLPEKEQAADIIQVLKRAMGTV